MPEKADRYKLPRQWLISLLYTLIGKPFADWSLELMQARNSKIIEKRNLGIEMDPEIAEAFAQSTFVSSKFFKTLVT